MIIKGEASEIQINILRRSNPDAKDFWDGNWLDTEIRIHIRQFICLYGANLRVDDFQRFYESLVAFRNTQKPEIEFTTLEEALYLHFVMGDRGLIICKGKGNDNAGISIEFNFEIEIMVIEYLIAEVKKILSSYPIIEGKA